MARRCQSDSRITLTHFKLLESMEPTVCATTFFLLQWFAAKTCAFPSGEWMRSVRKYLIGWIMYSRFINYMKRIKRENFQFSIFNFQKTFLINGSWRD